MSLATYSAYLATRPHAILNLARSNRAITAGRTYSRWVDTIGAAAPSAPVACDSSTVGAIPVSRLAAGNLASLPTWVKTVRLGRVAGGGATLLYDRLSHMGGLSATSVAVQTTNLPTAALPRYVSGVGVLAFLELYGTVGTTASTFSVSYTNSAGVAGRTSPATTIGGNTADRAIGSMIPIPLQVGDIGVRSVESFTMSVSAGTAGNLGITLMRPLYVVYTWDEAHGFAQDTVRDFGAMFEPVQADACVAMTTQVNSTDTFPGAGALELIKQV